MRAVIQRVVSGGVTIAHTKRESARDRLTEAFSTDHAPFGAPRAAPDPRAARDAR